MRRIRKTRTVLQHLYPYHSFPQEKKKQIRIPKTAGSTPEQPPITAIFDFANESSPKLKRKEANTQNPLRFPTNEITPKRSRTMPNPKKHAIEIEYCHD